MTGPELLKLAAKACAAAGMPIIESVAGPQILQRTTLDGIEHYRIWDQLTDDGDAFRLAVKLHIGVRCNSPTHWQNPGESIALWDLSDGPAGRVQVAHGDDPAVATRRAIVRAAAEIGKSMP